MTYSEMIRHVLMSMPGLHPSLVKAALNRAYSDLAFGWEWAALEKELTIPVYSKVDQTDAEDGETVAGDNACTVTNGSTRVYLDVNYTTKTAAGWIAALDYVGMLEKYFTGIGPNSAVSPTVDHTADIFTIADELDDGTPCYVTATTVPEGLTASTTYYLGNQTEVEGVGYSYTLHTTSAGAIAGDADQVTFTSNGTAVSLNWFSNDTATTTLDPVVLIRIEGEDQAYRISTYSIAATEDYARLTLVLSTAYQGDTNTDADFSIFKTLYSLSNTPTVRQVLGVVKDQSLIETTRAGLDRIDPERTSTGTSPTRWAKAGVTSAMVPLIELWPITTSDDILKVRVRVEPTALSSDTDVPLLHPMLIILDAQIQLHAAYTHQDPKMANALFNSFGVWRTQRTELYNTLVHEDSVRHSTSKVVRDVAPGWQDEGVGATVYNGGDITTYTP